MLRSLRSPFPATTGVAERELARRLRQLARLFDVDALLGETLDDARVRAYYRQCPSAYRKHHSPEGAAHMALTPGGRFDPDGFAEQLRRIEGRWQTPPQDVLEIGFGQGYNLGWLAPRHPATRFHGIDLTPEHLALARARIEGAGLPNVQLQLADLHRLPQADASLDEVFAIEAFCYARDLPRAFAEVARVLRPGGRFTLFDGYQLRPLTALPSDAALAAQLVARGMALERWQVLPEFLAQGRAAGLVLEADIDLAAEVLPNLQRLARLTGAIIRLPWLARRALARRAPERSRNVLAGVLMHPTVALGILGYRQLVWRKPAAGDVA